MKKIMIIAAVAMAAFATHAAAFSWKTSATGKLYTAGDSSVLVSSATMYLFCASDVTQSSIVSAFAAGSVDLTSGSIAEGKGTLTAGAVGTTQFEYGSVGSTYDFYVATIVDDKLFISDIFSGAGQEGKTKALSAALKTASTRDVMDASAGYTTGGWYQAVPEPTSGLLMLLGMAGLALRRRRA